MIGPGECPPGGISALVDCILPKLESMTDLLYFGTSKKSRPSFETGKWSIQNILLAFEQFLSFLRVIYRYRPTIIHLHTSEGLAWLKDTFYIFGGKLFHAKVLVHVHAASFGELYAKRNWIERTYTKFVFGMADCIIALSESWAKAIKGITPGNILVMPNCVDTTAIQPPSNGGRKKNSVLFLGSLGQRKGTFDLVDAWIKLNQKGVELSLWLAGSDDDRFASDKIKNAVEKFSFRESCHLLGPIEGEKKIALLQQATLLALPSYNEGMPMAVIEGMAAGLPIISTNVGGIPELVNDGENGYLLNPGDVEGLSEKLARLVLDGQLCQQMGLRSREYALEKYSNTEYTDRLIRLYSDILSENSHAKRSLLDYGSLNRT